MKNRFSKILVAALALALLLCATLALSVSASTTPEIISQNIEYGEKFSIMYAVDANTVADGAVTLAVYAEAPADGVNPLKTYTVSAPQTETINGEAKSVYVFTTAGVSAKDFADVFYAQATDAAGNKSAVVKYSVVQYMLERLYGGYDITPNQKDLYTEAIEFGAAAQDLLAADDAIKVTDYNYVRVVGGTVNGVEKAMFVKGETVTLSANAKGWQATVNGETVKLDGTSYVVAGNALIETYAKPLDLTTIYYTTQQAAGEHAFDYDTIALSDIYAGGKYVFIKKSGWMNYYEGTSPWASIRGRDASDDTNKALVLGKNANSSGAKHTMLYFYNINATDKNCVVFETEFKISMVATSMFSDTSGRGAVWFGFVNTNNDVLDNSDMVNIGEIGGPCKDGVFTSLKFADQTFENNVWYRLTMEYYKAEGVINYYINGYLVKTVSVDKNLEMPNAKMILNGAAYGSCLYMDNTYFGTVDKTLAK